MQNVKRTVYTDDMRQDTQRWYDCIYDLLSQGCSVTIGMPPRKPVEYWPDKPKQSSRHQQDATSRNNIGENDAEGYRPKGGL